MPIVTTTRTAPMIEAKYSSRGSSACGLSDVYRVVTVAREISTTNATARRAYPGTPLLAQTALPEQSTDTRGVASCYQKSYPSSSCVRRLYTYETPAAARHVQAVCEPPSVDWTLKARLKIKELAQNLGASVFEFRETAKMFEAAGRAVGSAWKAYREVRRPRFSGRFSPCSVAAAELTFSFGVNPLLGELYDGVNQLNTALGKPLYRRVSVTSSDATQGTLISPFAPAGWIPGTSGEIVWGWKRSCRAILYVRLVPDASDFIMGNPAEVAWELTPFSWLVDGLIDVGSYLSSLDALKEVKSITGTVTWKNRITADAKLRWSTYPNYGLRGRSKMVTHRRDLASSIPVPPIPRWNPSRSWRKIMHAVSALTVINSRCKRASWSHPFAPNSKT